MRLRALIESGRQYYWDIWQDSYKNSVESDYINLRKYYDQKLKKIVIVESPQYWTHFIEFVKENCQNFSEGLMELLNGGNGSLYNEFSSDIHTVEEKSIIEMVLFYKDKDEDKHLYNSIVNLFQLVFKKNIDEACR